MHQMMEGDMSYYTHLNFMLEGLLLLPTPTCTCKTCFASRVPHNLDSS